ncbi:hypothetical protein GCM10011396_38230 [Undibacterium terreum]|uniref:Uncharacterized protein n=1 Tax=Undibacterium terreum TaxID=1224302 RepID=A0A916UUA2_9BURK|nr:hypothetical protein GCM10011396_38230 [Undibacterium terreum]
MPAPPVGTLTLEGLALKVAVGGEIEIGAIDNRIPQPNPDATEVIPLAVVPLNADTVSSGVMIIFAGTPG